MKSKQINEISTPEGGVLGRLEFVNDDYHYERNGGIPAAIYCQLSDDTTASGKLCFTTGVDENGDLIVRMTIDENGNIDISGDLVVGGSFLCSATTTRITDSDSPYTILSTDEIIYGNTNAGDILVNLPVGVDGTHYKIVNCGVSGNDITLDPNGAELVWGVGSGVMRDGDILDIDFEPTEGWW